MKVLQSNYQVSVLVIASVVDLKKFKMIPWDSMSEPKYVHMVTACRKH